MTETCSKCGRPSLYGANRSEPESMIAAAKYGWCEGERTMVCREQAAGFLRGAAWMLETAKRHAKPSTCERCATPVPYGTIEWERAHCTECGTDVDFTDVDAALEARGK